MDLTFNLCLHTNLKATKQSIANWLKCDDLRNPHPSTPTIYGIWVVCFLLLLSGQFIRIIFET